MMMRSLEECRQQLDEVDRDIVRLFEQRMMIARDVAAYKIAHDLPVLDASREREKLQDIAGKTPEALQEYALSLYSLIFELSRSHQSRILGRGSEVV
jgi:chorismate mutase/prephenate dehydratase